MEDAPQTAAPVVASRLRFSLGNLLAFVAIVCFTVTMILSTSRLEKATQLLTEVKRQLAAHQPMSAAEVANEFEKQTTMGQVVTKVQDVRYSKAEDTYDVEFSFTDGKTQQVSTTGVHLKGDGYGRWSGQIRSDPFLAAVGRTPGDFYSVSVKTPVKLRDD
jgi:hypothetical protein